MTTTSSADPALSYPDGLRRIRPAHVIRCGLPQDITPTRAMPYTTLEMVFDAWLLRLRSAS